MYHDMTLLAVLCKIRDMHVSADTLLRDIAFGVDIMGPHLWKVYPEGIDSEPENPRVGTISPMFESLLAQLKNHHYFVVQGSAPPWTGEKYR